MRHEALQPRSKSGASRRLLSREEAGQVRGRSSIHGSTFGAAWRPAWGTCTYQKSGQNAATRQTIPLEAAAAAAQGGGSGSSGGHPAGPAHLLQ